MADDFMREFRDEDDHLEPEIPDWEQQLGEVEETEDEDDIDRLRRRTVRTGAAYDDMSADETAVVMSTQSGGLISSFTPAQRLILAILLLLNIIVIGLGVLAVTGRI
jgi:hypothetical protein